jgi:hypothetical protein
VEELEDDHCHRVARHPNSRVVLERRHAAGAVTLGGPASMLFARSFFAIAANAFVAVILAVQGATEPWRDAARWFPVYATLIDVSCLALLWGLMRREGARLLDLIGLDRARLGVDALCALLLIIPSLVVILGGIAGAGLIVYGSPRPPAAHALAVSGGSLCGARFPAGLGFIEQMTYNGYLAPPH